MGVAMPLSSSFFLSLLLLTNLHDNSFNHIFICYIIAKMEKLLENINRNIVEYTRLGNNNISRRKQGI